MALVIPGSVGIARREKVGNAERLILHAGSPSLSEALEFRNYGAMVSHMTELDQ